MKFIFIRHGETIENKKGIIQGHTQGTLSKLGIIQAQKVAKRLKKERITQIYSSDLERAYETAKIINNFHNLKIKKTKLLREFAFGKFSGMPKKMISLNHPEIETVKMAKKRIREFLCLENFGNQQNQIILIIFHGGIGKILISEIIKDKKDIGRKWQLLNTSVTILQNNKLTLFNCVKHLNENKKIG